ncbi:hypothetical protein [Spirillospora sp. NPDC047279]|uniref:hypothetical protein n=1 Tax=Spirillospora sp. NPDC047279 TaxID=3155478 RepID=UPI0033F0E486
MTAPQTTYAHQEVRQLLADPAMTEHSPGEEFAHVASLHDDKHDDVTVSYRAYLPAAFPLFANRPRYTVRHLLKVATVRDEETPYFQEVAPHDDDRTAGGRSYEQTLEASFTPVIKSTDLTEISVSVETPPGLENNVRLLASYIDYRLLVRFGVRENQLLLHGEQRYGPDAEPVGRRGGEGSALPGLLQLPGLRRLRSAGDPVAELTAAAGAVEETGGSCDGIVVHPSLYWRMVETGRLGPLNEAGIRVSRTRMMPPEQVLLGDFRAAATLLDPGTSWVTLRRGAGANGGHLLEARSRIALAVHLPRHFLLLDRGEAA